MAMGGFRQNAVGPPKWDDEAMEFMVWVKCATSAECIQSIDSHVLGYGHNSGVGHTMDQHL